MLRVPSWLAGRLGRGGARGEHRRHGALRRPGRGSVRDARPAAEVVQELAANAEALMRRSDRIGAQRGR